MTQSTMLKPVVDGFTFACQMDADRYRTLKQMQARGEIKGFRAYPSYTLVKAYRKCPCCGKLSDEQEVCDLCGVETYASSGIKYYADFLVLENDGCETIEEVSNSLALSHEFNLKKILYDQLYSTPIRIVVDGVRYKKDVKGWRKEDA